MSIKTTKQRLISGEKFTIRRASNNYIGVRIFYIDPITLPSYPTEFRVMQQICENVYNILEQHFVFGYKIDVMDNDHMIIRMSGIKQLFHECIPYSSIIFIDDLKAELAQTPKVN